MQCKNCGTPIEPGNKFCENCGTPVPDTEPVVENNYTDSEETYAPFAPQNETTEQTEPTSTSEPGSIPEKAKKKVNVPLIISVSVVAVVLVVALVIRFLPALQKDKPSSAVDNQSTSQSYDETTIRDFTGDNSSSEYSDIVNPDFSYNPVTYYVKPIEGLNLRKGPGADYDSLLTLQQNESVEILGGSETNENWAYVRYSVTNDYGWLSTQQLSSTPIFPAEPSTPHGVDYYDDNSTYEVYVRPAVGLNLRTGPGEQYDRITLLEEGSVLTVLGVAQEDREWSYIRFGSLYGFIKTEYVNNY